MLDLAAALQELGTEAALVCPDCGALAERGRSRDLPVIAVEKRGALDWRAIGRIRRLLRSGQIEILHCHNGRTALLGALACFLARRGRLVMTQHFIAPASVRRSGWKGLLSSAIHRWLNWRLDALIAISESVRSATLRRGDISDGKVTVVPNGIGDPAESPLRDRVTVRRELGVSNSGSLIVTVARLEPEKGLETLLRAIKAIQAFYPGLRCAIAGVGSLRAELEAQTKAAGLETTVRFLGFQNDVFSLLHASDLFAFPSPNEPFGLALVEAMALAKPVVAVAAGGPVEIVMHGEGGLLCPPSDEAAFATALRSVLDDRKLGEIMGRNGRERFEERYTSTRMAVSTIAVYLRARGPGDPNEAFTTRTETAVAVPASRPCL